MDKSDLDTYQNIVVASTGANNADGTAFSTNTTHANASAQSAQVCQVCGVMLRLDPSIHNINEATYRQLSTPFSSRDEIDTTISGNVDADMEISASAFVNALSGLERSTAPGAVTTNDCEDCEPFGGGGAGGVGKIYEPLFRKSMAPRSFYLCPTNINIAESNHQSTMANNDLTGWSAQINTVSALFDLMSSNTTIDHPLCEECADKLVNLLDDQCKLIEKEHSDYANLINKLNQQASNDNELRELEKELEQLEMEEKELLGQIKEAEGKEAELVKEREEKQAEEARLLQQEQVHLLEYSNLKRQLIKLEEKQESLDNQVKNTKLHFNRLRSVNVLNATFHIWHSGPFGTINYFRLGRLPDTPVEWDEINAGLGQVNLLLYCLARRAKLEFERFRLVPYGNFSYIEVIENCTIHNYTFKAGTEVQMHRTKGVKYYLEWDSKFDMGMIAFLDCLEQFEKKIKSLDAEFSMPYRINGYKIEDKHSSSSYSIKCHFNSYEEWTKALKYMLTNLKWSLAWVTNMTAS